MISFLCTHCGAQLRARPEQAGSKNPCPRCGQPVEAPSGVTARPTNPTSRADFETVATRPAELEFLAPPQSGSELGRLGKYRVLKVIGQGGMGLVLLGEDINLKRRVALKVMKKSQAAAADSRARFLREVRAAAAIDHDHIVTIYEADIERGVPYIAMKLLVGETLEDRLNREGKLPAEEVIRIGQEVALGLAEAHERGLIHRDIKPANVWLEEGTGRVKILDFGLALAEDADVKLTQDNYLVGTPAYMSPEQADGEREVDARSDLFSLGSVLYRCCTGKLPFMGKNTMQVLNALGSKTPRAPAQVDDEVPEALSHLIMQMLHKAPEDRPKSARVLVAMLAEVRDAPGGYEEVEEEEDEEIIEEVEEVEEKPKPKKRRFKPHKSARPQETAEERLGRRVIWFGIIAAIGVFLLLVALIIQRNFFRSS